MPNQKDSDPRPEGSFSGTLRRRFGQGVYYLTQWFSMLKVGTENTRHQLKEAFYTTSDQVLEKAEVTRKSVKIRMAMLEIEHHLNRLYPQIGKIACDLSASASGTKNWAKDEQLKSKINLAEEYRQRLAELKQELTEHQRKSRPPGK